MYGIYCLIITPTRELAKQIQKHIEILSGDIPVRICLLTGGIDYLKQIEILEGKPHFVIGWYPIINFFSPGRIESAMRQFDNYNFFKKIKYLVFDEADRLLTSEFCLDIDIIIKSVSKNRQTLLYSATMNDQVKKLAKISIGKDMFIFDACDLFQTSSKLTQTYLFMPKTVKDCYLLSILRTLNKKEIAIVFFNNIEECELLCETFKQLNLKCGSLHSYKPQTGNINKIIF
jgi:ATP-dependent RNA helicase DDX49/DBP8